MRRINKISALFLVALFFCFQTVLPVYAKTVYPKPTTDFFVNDFAGLLDPSNKAEIQKKGEALYSSTTAQAVVVTVESLEGQSIEEYSIYLAREWGIGDAEKDNGVLLLLALKEREVRIEVGSGLEGAITDLVAWQIIRNYGMEHLKKDAFSTALAEMYGAIVNEVYLEYGKEPNEDYVPLEELQTQEEKDPFLVRIILIVLIIALSLLLSRRRRGGGGNGGHGDGMPFFFFMPGGFRGGHGGGFTGGGGFSGGGFRGSGGGFSGGGSSSKF